MQLHHHAQKHISWGISEGISGGTSRLKRERSKAKRQHQRTGTNHFAVEEQREITESAASRAGQYRPENSPESGHLSSITRTRARGNSAVHTVVDGTFSCITRTRANRHDIHARY